MDLQELQSGVALEPQSHQSWIPIDLGVTRLTPRSTLPLKAVDCVVIEALVAPHTSISTAATEIMAPLDLQRSRNRMRTRVNQSSDRSVFFRQTSDRSSLSVFWDWSQICLQPPPPPPPPPPNNYEVNSRRFERASAFLYVMM